MANRVTINICGDEYTFIADESATYMQKVGTYVSEKMEEVLNTAKVGRTDAAILTAANIAAARAEEPFFSVEDLQIRAKLSKAVIDILRTNGALDNIQETDQLTMRF